MNQVGEFYAPDRAAWRAWLLANHEHETGVWLVYDKGAARTMQWEDIVQEALCFGWIDSLPRKREDGRSMIYVSKRKPKGVWSKINKAHVEVLVASGHMMPAGLAAIETAKANGAWDTLNKSDNLELPPELVAGFARDTQAKQHFELFSESARRQILQWIYSAKRDETKARRITETITAAHDNLKVNQWLVKPPK